MFRTTLAAALVASVLAAAHHERVLDRSGLLGGCTTLATATVDGSKWLRRADRLSRSHARRLHARRDAR